MQNFITMMRKPAILIACTVTLTILPAYLLSSLRGSNVPTEIQTRLKHVSMTRESGIELTYMLNSIEADRNKLSEYKNGLQAILDCHEETVKLEVYVRDLDKTLTVVRDVLGTSKVPAPLNKSLQYQLVRHNGYWILKNDSFEEWLKAE